MAALRFVIRLESLMFVEVVKRVKDPHQENRVYIEGQEAVFGFSSLMTFLMVLLGAGRPFEKSSSIFSKALGVPVSSTAVQRNREEAWEQLSDEPYDVIEQKKHRRRFDVMLVEMDSTASPYIHEEEGIVGRESLKQPTEWKMCNVGTAQRLKEGKVCHERTVARYGTLESFGRHPGRTALASGQENAQEVVFLADGLHANWQIYYDQFLGALQILDFYQAAEHLAHLCSLPADPQKAQNSAQKWRTCLLEGQVLQVMAEMKAVIPTLSETEEGWREYRYFRKNWRKMSYDQHAAEGLPIGGGKVEGGYKFVVGKRFKGNGMRWKKADNKKILRARLASLKATWSATANHSHGLTPSFRTPTRSQIRLSKGACRF